MPMMQHIKVEKNANDANQCHIHVKQLKRDHFLTPYQIKAPPECEEPIAIFKDGNDTGKVPNAANINVEAEESHREHQDDDDEHKGVDIC